MKPWITVITIGVEDLERSLAFYRDGIGWKTHDTGLSIQRSSSDELLDELLKRIVVLGRSPGGIMIASLHAAPKDADAPSGAVGFRQAMFNVSLMTVWRDPALDAEQIQGARARYVRCGELAQFMMHTIE